MLGKRLARTDPALLIYRSTACGSGLGPKPDPSLDGLSRKRPTGRFLSLTRESIAAWAREVFGIEQCWPRQVIPRAVNMVGATP